MFVEAYKSPASPSGARSPSTVNYRHWEEAIRLYVDRLLAGSEGPRERDFTCAGSPRSSRKPYRILIRGGIFSIPPTAGRIQQGRLRLVYEANPSPHHRECPARGTTSIDRILDLVPGKSAPARASGFRLPPRGGAHHPLSRRPNMIGDAAPLFGKPVCSGPEEKNIRQIPHHLHHRIVRRRTPTVKDTFEKIFKRGTLGVLHRRRCLHPFDRETMRKQDRGGKSPRRRLHAFLRAGERTGDPRKRSLPNMPGGVGRTVTTCTRSRAAKFGSDPGTFTDWEDSRHRIFSSTRGCMAAPSRRRVNLAQHCAREDRRRAVINLEWIQKIHRDKRPRLLHRGVTDTILRRMPDYVNYICRSSP